MNLVEFAGQPELGVWNVYEQSDPPGNLCWIHPHSNVPDGLVALAECGTIGVRRNALRLARPQQKETLFP